MSTTSSTATPTPSRPWMLPAHFYTLIGALDSAYYFIDNYYRITGMGGIVNVMQTIVPRQGEETALTRFLGLNSENNKATPHPTLDPDPGAVADAHGKLLTIKVALLRAESKLALELYLARGIADGAKAEEGRKKARGDFHAVLTTQTFVYATAVRRLIWNPTLGTGAPEWQMMEERLQRILKAFAQVSRGGGDDEGCVNDWSCSDGSISF